MPLSHLDQLSLIEDILTNHLEDCCGSVSECEQLERLVESLLQNGQMPTEISSVLGNIQHYSQAGKSSPDLEAHINAHQEAITQWVGQINL